MKDEAGGKMRVSSWPLDKLQEYEKNPRKNDHAVERVAAAIREFGFRVPVIARSDGKVVDGHLRLKAARALGLKEVPVVLADDLTDDQVRAFRISVNRMAELADWDEDLLALELEELQKIDFDLNITGLDEQEIKKLLDLCIGDLDIIDTSINNGDNNIIFVICPKCGFKYEK
jgi:ParB-like chromosome segregation protein Spo0J